MLLLGAAPLRAATFTWTGLGADAKWSTGGNWSGGLPPANDGSAAIVLAGSAQLSPVVDAPWDIFSLTFNSTAGAFTLSGSALTTRTGGIASSSTAVQTINNAITMNGAQTWSATSGNLIFGGAVNNSGALLTLSGTFAVTLNSLLK